MLLPNFLTRSKNHLQPASSTTVPMFLMVLTLLAAASSTAQETDALPVDPADEIRRYTIELIVFSFNDSKSGGNEIFDPLQLDEPVDLVDFDLNSGSLDRPASGQEDEFPVESVLEFGDFVDPVVEPLEEVELRELIAEDRLDLKVLMPDELTMIDIHEKLVTLDAYRPVMWAGWTQAVFAEEETPPIHLRRLGNLPLDFDGDLKLYVSRFLHLIVDISMEESPSSASDSNVVQPDPLYDRRTSDRFGAGLYERSYEPDPTPVVIYKILEDRILKNGDIRYFDHPRFGLLVKAVRYVEPEVEEPEDDLFLPEALGD